MQLTHRREEGEASTRADDLPRVGIDEYPCSTGLGEPYVIGTMRGGGYGDARDLYTIGDLRCDTLQKHAERQRLLVGYRCHALVLDEGGDFLLEDEQSPREAGRHDDKSEGQGEPQMELLKEFAYSHNSTI